MGDMPPRRSRRPQNKRSKDSSFPLNPYLIGVIVLGFVIGAGFSMAGKRGADADVARVVASAAPTVTPTFAPATLAPLATPRPVSAKTGSTSDDATDTPQAEDSESPEPRASATHDSSPKPSFKPSLKPSAFPSNAVAKASASPHATERSSATPMQSTLIPSPVTPVPAKPHVVATKTPAPALSPTAVTSAASAPVAHAPAATAVPATTIDADSEFGRLSANVVEQYLRALRRGDTDSAYGAFGVSPGSGGVSFPEQPAMAAPGQIVNIQSRGNADTQYVTVDISTPSGTYYATYGVHHTATGAAVITTHSISKQ